MKVPRYMRKGVRGACVSLVSCGPFFNNTERSGSDIIKHSAGLQKTCVSRAASIEDT